MADPLQVWVRNEKGKVWGPVMPATLELLFDNQIIPGKVQVSLDGMNYVYPSRMPEIRNSVPRELWGEGGPPAEEIPVAPARSAVPGGPPTLGGPPVLGGNAPPGGPVRPAGGAPMAGPGAVGQASGRA